MRRYKIFPYFDGTAEYRGVPIDKISGGAKLTYQVEAGGKTHSFTSTKAVMHFIDTLKKSCNSFESWLGRG